MTFMNAKVTRYSVAALLVLVSACRSLDVTNPNEPDNIRALGDPGTVASIAGGTLRSWFNTTQGMEGTGPLVTMADSYTASWNNFNMRLYSSQPRAQWANDQALAARTSIEHYWYGYYSMLSSANDVLLAIRENALVINTPAETKRAETIAVLAQGLAYSALALNYDKAFLVDEKTDLSQPLEFSTRQEMRDAAVTKFNEAATLASANSFTTPAEWTNGTSYSSNQIARLARTMAARTLVYFARNAAENTATNWATVASLASQGMSSGTPFDLIFTGDFDNFYDELKAWSNDLTTMRVDTRVANLLDPATQRHPWPDPNGNPPPNSPDARLGDGTDGTDFVYDAAAIFPPARGQYHQSNIAHIRYEYASFNDPGGTGGGFGDVPVVTATENDLLWAEGLIRSGGSLTQAAALINKTRVGRGHLVPALPTESQASLLLKLQYEQEIELMGLGPQPFYNRRRIDGLQPLTPRHMPVPAKELGVLQQELYTFGGTGNPAGMNVQISDSPTPRVKNVHQQWNDIWEASKARRRAGRLARS